MNLHIMNTWICTSQRCADWQGFFLKVCWAIVVRLNPTIVWKASKISIAQSLLSRQPGPHSLGIGGEHRRAITNKRDFLLVRSLANEEADQLKRWWHVKCCVQFLSVASKRENDSSIKVRYLVLLKSPPTDKLEQVFPAAQVSVFMFCLTLNEQPVENHWCLKMLVNNELF